MLRHGDRVQRAWRIINELYMPIRIEVTDQEYEGEPLYAVQDFLFSGPNQLMTVSMMPTWMQERFALLLINPDPMFEIENVGFCFDRKTFYVRGEETDDE